MAKRRNKSRKIREMFEELGPGATARQVVETLAERRVRVSPAQVYNLRARLGKPAAGISGKAKAKSDGYGDLIAAKRLADAMGGIDQARAALDVLARLL